MYLDPAGARVTTDTQRQPFVLGVGDWKQCGQQLTEQRRCKGMGRRATALSCPTPLSHASTARTASQIQPYGKLHATHPVSLRQML